MLSPTYEITTALSHTDELISPPYDIAIVTISYGRVTMSSVWDSMMSKKNMGWPFYAAVQDCGNPSALAMELLHFALSHRNNMSSTIANEWVLSSNCELTKWPPFCKQHFHFQMVLEWWLWYIYSNFTKVCSWVSNWQCVAIDLGDGSIPNRWQATTETNIG